MRTPLLLFLTEYANEITETNKVAREEVNILTTDFGVSTHLLEDARLVVFQPGKVLNFPLIPYTNEPFSFLVLPNHGLDKAYMVRIILNLHDYETEGKVSATYDRRVVASVHIKTQSRTPLMLSATAGMLTQNRTPLVLNHQIVSRLAVPLVLSHTIQEHLRTPVNLSSALGSFLQTPLVLEHVAFQDSWEFIFAIAPEGFVGKIPLRLSFTRQDTRVTPLVLSSMPSLVTQAPAYVGIEYENTLRQEAVVGLQTDYILTTDAVAGASFIGTTKASAVVGINLVTPQVRVTSARAYAEAHIVEEAGETVRVTKADAVVGVDLEVETVIVVESTTIFNPTHTPYKIRIAGIEYTLEPYKKFIVPAHVSIFDVDAPISVLEDKIRNKAMYFSGGTLEMTYEYVSYKLTTIAERFEFDRCVREKRVYRTEAVFLSH